MAKANTVKGIEALIRKKEPGNFSAGQGLFLRINKNGNAYWYYRFQLNKKRTTIGLGNYEALSLAEARKQANDYKSLVSQGINPVEQREEEKRQELAKTVKFRDVANEYIESHRKEWKSPKTAQKWEGLLNNYINPVIGDLPPKEIEVEHILKILKPIWQTFTDSAPKARSYIETILNLAKAKGLRTGENVATWRGNLEFYLPKVNRSQVRHHPALPYKEISSFYHTLKKSNSSGAQALQLLILTATRTSEVIKATWKEIQGNEWIIPAERMKVGREHRIPLSKEAIKLLDSLPRTGAYLFEGMKEGTHISNMAMLMQTRRMHKRKLEVDGKGWIDRNGAPILVHGFRSTFRDWANEATNYQYHIIETALAHNVGSAVERAYSRSDLLEKRRHLMEAWAQYITKEPAKVINLRNA